MHRRVWAGIGLVLAGWLAGAFSQAADAPTEATVTDSEGKEVKVAALKFGTGTHRLSWLADPNGATEDAKKGPLALELREPHSTTYSKGIITYVPVGSVESVKYDYEKQLSSVAVKGVTEPLVGTLQYKGINVLAFSGTVDSKATTFSGGAFTKGNIKAVVFPEAKPVVAKKGSPWHVQIDQAKAMDPTLKAANFKFLYQFPGGVEVLTDAATVRKGEPFKLDDTVKAFTPVAVDQNTHMAAVEVQIGDVEKVVVILVGDREGRQEGYARRAARRGGCRVEALPAAHHQEHETPEERVSIQRAGSVSDGKAMPSLTLPARWTSHFVSFHTFAALSSLAANDDVRAVGRESHRQEELLVGTNGGHFLAFDHVPELQYTLPAAGNESLAIR